MRKVNITKNKIIALSALFIIIGVVLYALYVLNLAANTRSEFWQDMFLLAKNRIITKEAREDRQILIPSKKIDMKWFSIYSPLGWETTHTERWDNSGYLELLLFQGWHKYESLFYFSPFFSINKSNFDMLEAKNNSLLFSFLRNEKETDLFTLEIAEKNCSLLLYKGSASIYPTNPDGIVHNPDIEDSITVLFQFEDMSLFGYFWGFENDYKDFLDCLNSIEWLTD